MENLDIGDQTPPAPVREGLPPRYRMRADAHYVEQLDSSLFSSPIRHLDVRSIDPAPREAEQAISTAFLESIRRHGVLQPLLVRSRGTRFQVMAGNRRLAAAVEVGLSEVPCLVERVDDEQARALAAATNVPSTPHDSAQVGPDRPHVEPSFAALADCLAAVASSAGLLSSGSALTQGVAADLVRAEASRALQLLRALQVIKGEVRPRRRSVFPRAVTQRVLGQIEAERRLRGLVVTVDRDGTDCPPLSADEDLLVTSVGALIVAGAALLENGGAQSVVIDVTTRPDGAVAFVVQHEGAELPPFWRSTLAEDSWNEGALPGGAGATTGVTMLRAARQVAEAHGGRMSVDCSEGSTSFSIAVPSARS